MPFELETCGWCGLPDPEHRSECPYGRAWEDRTVYKGFRVSDLRKVFNKLANPQDWRGPIAASMPGEAVLGACAAIEYCTATLPRVCLDTRTMTYVVTSEGYRMGPAGDH
ncbi:MAG: hypothetical protein LAP85_21990 [Acidobacteriia bacterium]|nr:hypothetical protein [Terriglobia bacterium]